MAVHKISPELLTLSQVDKILKEGMTLELSQESKERIVKCREYLDNKMKTQKEPIYGVTTGFGSLCNISISKEQLSQLQKNLVMSHACGVGEEVPAEIVKIMLLNKIQSLSYGNSGVQLQTVERLIAFFNNDILPVVYQQGSLGASGDLAPLAHMCLPLLGLGQVDYKGRRISGEELNKEFNWQPIELQSKEGLALLNGTQFMSSFAVWCVIKAQKLSDLADKIMVVSLEGFDGRIEPFFDPVHQVRPHAGQIETAKRVREMLEGSQIIAQPKKHVQDPYSFRCVPQVHGASKDAIAHVASVITTEINSATDNPTVFPDLDMVISAGNFHGQPLAINLDYLAIAVAELGSISERRTYQLIGAKRDLPSFLVAKPGLNSGFMIPQYAAASVVSQSKQLCTPASVDTIDSSQGQEDHVSFGSNAATKLYRVVNNTERVLAIELFNAAQAFDFRKQQTGLSSSKCIEDFVKSYREKVAFVQDDVVMYELIHKSIDFLRDQQ
ncbi:MAG: histidine ammonia-lyase [Bacteroidales bacterium]|jgi:histidine ammonia-lyase|nr:histidine ammonia-lyase [Bacteroidales bacterium]MEE1112853.1 histidine ammonia-lyase [Bacteroidales bacterium]MEE1143141.1 histidine ammonia-lyase [Bacteroidales bacterium]MEE1226686.1 histidine ammonia-lyase [Bacteroidales bacterium]